VLILGLDESDLSFWYLFLEQFFHQFHLTLAQLVAGVRPSRHRQQQQQHERGRPHLALWVQTPSKRAQMALYLWYASSGAEEKGLAWARTRHTCRYGLRPEVNIFNFLILLLALKC
jgi:hypothetical protein